MQDIEVCLITWLCCFTTQKLGKLYDIDLETVWLPWSKTEYEILFPLASSERSLE